MGVTFKATFLEGGLLFTVGKKNQEILVFKSGHMGLMKPGSEYRLAIYKVVEKTVCGV